MKSQRNKFHKSAIVFLGSLILFGCKTIEVAGVQEEQWGEIDGKEVFHYTLTNSNGVQVKITNFGGIITSILVPDNKGVLGDVVLGFDNLKQYQEGNPCFGATIGRFANRIRNGRFEIGGVIYQLEQNAGAYTLHGGNEFDRVVWDAQVVENGDTKAVKLHYLSKDGSKGFPGNLETYVTYTLTDDNSVEVHFEATTDKTTNVNMTQHSYFNLNGCREPIYDHSIKIAADNYTEIDDEIIPVGTIATVNNTDWDLTTMTRIGENIKKLDFNGYHYCYAFNKPLNKFEEVIEVVEPKSGRTLTVSTTQPGVQFYSGNTIGNKFIGKNNIQYADNMAFCLETQHFPDSPNHTNFPSTLFKPGEKYDELVVYKFGVTP
ncbi:aldose epimerase family protein [Kriegella aquimaris]|uniref:Aldose 1-epimerase n=1 Tax=Kriegella aquimaris TaxID=192904 RepID=A0A1G9ULL5_9FLAO|nr:aldose epimerase family protein [Kriegella aquimaris]SDM60820.1 aldose 1-epimerase [Kriegella aquimaris]